MNKKPLKDAQDSDLRGSWPALIRAGERARRIAAQTQTAVVYSENGKLIHRYMNESAALSKTGTQEPEIPYSTNP